MSLITINDALLEGQKHLRFNTSNYKNETLWIMQKSLNVDLVYILENKFKAIHNEKYKLFIQLIKRRSKEPLQHILNMVDFYGYNFNISKNVFIPRPETEVFIDILKKHVGYSKNVLEIGTGCGCISIALELEQLSDNILSIDVNCEALELAKVNAKKFKCSKINFLYQNLFNFVPHKKYDLIISNPPYIPVQDISSLDHIVKFYDPLEALTDYDDGLSFYRYFSKLGIDFLCKNGYMLFEFGGTNQVEALRKIFNNKCYHYVFLNDLNNEPRFILIKKTCY